MEKVLKNIKLGNLIRANNMKWLNLNMKKMCKLVVLNLQLEV